ncbi:glycosyltransferase [Agrococcus sp. TF02-05]|uniref:glycosyltransferase n=1 Tax=Agrococcus sp. TF02-05 TaxID=2815211 RepID=UPI001AA16C44|nr:glycosyltransferase [Agrococcus sp. TF02-05]MBO1769502.1 glycosyltransferase family 1 protein [Agrococcus sp. TF02-05]
MAHLVVTAMPFAGHVRPMTAVAAALIARGHRVSAYTGAKYADAFTDIGCQAVTWSAARDFDDQRVAEAFPGAGQPGYRGMLANLRDLFIGTAPGQVADLEALHRRDRFDAIVGDAMAVGSGLAAEVLNKPWVAVSVVPLAVPSRDLPPPGMGLLPATSWAGRLRDTVLRAAVPRIIAPLDTALRAVRDELDLGPGLPFDEALLSPQLTLATGCASLEFPRSDMPESVRFVGALVPAGPPIAPTPPWAETLALEPRPVVLVTQGTLDVDPHELLLPSLEALGALEVRVVGTTAGARVDATVPQNARLVDVLPFEAVLPHTAVVVTNGGWGGVLASLAHGVPLVVAGGTLDKPDVAARVGYSGAGIDLRTGRPRPARIAEAVREVLRRPRYRERAAAIADELAALGGADRAAELVDELLAAR